MLTDIHKGYLPTLISAHELWQYWLRQRQENQTVDPNTPLDDWGAPASKNRAFPGPVQPLLSGIFLGLANFFSIRVENEPRSTYICPSSSYGFLIVPILQFFGLFTQAFIIIRIAFFSKKPDSDVALEFSNPNMLLGSVFVVSSSQQLQSKDMTKAS